MKTDKAVPLQLLEAENAVQIAQVANADQYAKDTYDSADNLLRQAEAYQARKSGSKPVIMTVARGGAERRDVARLLALKRQEDERIAREKQAAADREAAARARRMKRRARRRIADAQAAESARQRLRRSAQSSRREGGRRSGARQRRGGATAGRAGQAERRRTAAAQAEQARLHAAAGRAESQEADRLRAQAEQAQQQLRQQLLQQFNLILETRDTARGLIVNMSDVLFDFNKYTLRPAAREKLAKISGIILSHPGLRLEVDGYTDSIGSDDYNLKLSDHRAGGVRDYLIGQGIAPDNVGAHRASAKTIRWRPTTPRPAVRRTAAWRWWFRATSSARRSGHPQNPTSHR